MNHKLSESGTKLHANPSYRCCGHKLFTIYFSLEKCQTIFVKKKTKMKLLPVKCLILCLRKQAQKPSSLFLFIIFPAQPWEAPTPDKQTCATRIDAKDMEQLLRFSDEQPGWVTHRLSKPSWNSSLSKRPSVMIQVPLMRSTTEPEVWALAWAYSYVTLACQLFSQIPGS